uniref:Uncharacterized protein n=1 Tax=Capra hircus TaxID=9925 RepID=A0A8C2PM66_CAPHI
MYFSIPETESRSGEGGGSANVVYNIHVNGVLPSVVSCVRHSRRYNTSSQKRSLWKCCSATGRKFWSTC